MIGAYVVEQDYSHYVAKQSDIIFGVVGTATKGDVNTPTLCTSTADFVRKFGPASSSHLGIFAGLYFLNQGNKLYFVRAQTDATPAVKATVTVPGKAAEDAAVAQALILTALTPGTYYNDLDIVVSTTVLGYKIVVTSNGVTLESKLYTLGGTVESAYYSITTFATGVLSLTTGTYSFAGGTDAASSLLSSDWIRAVDTLENDLYDINLFAIPGVSDNTVVLEAIRVAETRGDCMYLVDPPNDLEPDEVKDWHNAAGDYDGNTILNSSYAALYWSWQTVYDKETDSYIDLPPSAVVSAVMAKSARESEIWLPPAGLVRGLISGVSSPVYSPSGTERDALYADENAVNCIIEDPTYGLAVFGQKTLLRSATALNRVNVRMLLNYLKRIITGAAKYLVFEPNDSTTWEAFEDLIEPTLQSIGNRRGLYDYKIVIGEAIVSDEDIDNYRMPCKILLKPTKAAEEIPIYFTITSTGADFNSVLESEQSTN